MSDTMPLQNQAPVQSVAQPKVQDDWATRFMDLKGWKVKIGKKSAKSLQGLVTTIGGVKNDINNSAIGDPELKKLLTKRWQRMADDAEAIPDLAKADVKDELLLLQARLPANPAEYVSAFERYEVLIGEAVSVDPTAADARAQQRAAGYFQEKLREVVDGLDVPLVSDPTAPIQVTPREAGRALTLALNGYKKAREEPNSTEGKLLAAEGAEEFARHLTQLSQTVVGFGCALREVSMGEALAINSYMGPDYSNMNAVCRNAYQPNPGLTPREQAKEAAKLQILVAAVDSALGKLPNYRGATFRYERAWNQQVVDDRLARTPFTTQTYWSTGAGQAADIGGQWTPRFHFTIWGKTGKDVAAFAAIPGEGGAPTTKAKPGKKDKKMGKGEVLFPRGSTFNVKQAVSPSNPPPQYSKTDDGDTTPTIDLTVKQA